MDLPSLMQELATRIGLGTVDLDPDGGAQIVLGEQYIVDIAKAEDGPGFHLSAAVGSVPPDRPREAVYAELLTANLQGQGTGGTTLALDRLLDEIVLCRYLAHDDLAFGDFERELVTFVNALDTWQTRLATVGTDKTRSEPQDKPPFEHPPGFNIIRG